MQIENALFNTLVHRRCPKAYADTVCIRRWILMAGNAFIPDVEDLVPEVQTSIRNLFTVRKPLEDLIA